MPGFLLAGRVARALHYNPSMSLLALLLPAVIAPADFRIVEVQRHAVFAGRLGELVHEDLVLESEGQRVTLSVRGDYHTACVRPWQRLHEGETLRLDLRPGQTSVAREQLRRVK